MVCHFYVYQPNISGFQSGTRAIIAAQTNDKGHNRNTNIKARVFLAQHSYLICALLHHAKVDVSFHSVSGHKLHIQVWCWNLRWPPWLMNNVASFSFCIPIRSSQALMSLLNPWQRFSHSPHFLPQYPLHNNVYIPIVALI